MNYRLADWINGLSGHPWLDDIMKFCAVYLIFVAFAIFVVGLIPVARRRHWGHIGLALATLVVAFVLGIVASHLITEARPFTTHPDIHRLISHEAGQSFPSDHATAAFAFALATLAFVQRKLGWALFVVALVIGFARVYTGVHYPGDILGSFCCALVAVVIVAAVGAGLARRGWPTSPRPSAPPDRATS